jgi:hypothetical protein
MGRNLRWQSIAHDFGPTPSSVIPKRFLLSSCECALTLWVFCCEMRRGKRDEMRWVVMMSEVLEMPRNPPFLKQEPLCRNFPALSS